MCEAMNFRFEQIVVLYNNCGYSVFFFFLTGITVVNAIKLILESINVGKIDFDLIPALQCDKCIEMYICRVLRVFSNKKCVLYIIYYSVFFLWNALCVHVFSPMKNCRVLHFNCGTI